MAVAYRAGAAQNEADPGSSCTITIPGTIAAGDVLYVSACLGPGGYSTLTCTDNDAGGNTWTDLGNVSSDLANMWRKVATSGTASKTITVATTGGVTRLSAIVDGYSGANTSSPNDALAPESNASADETSTGITPSEAGCFIHLSVFVTGNDSVVSNATCTDPGALTARQQADTTSGADCTVASFSALQAAGPTATGNVTYSIAADATSITALLAIKPAAAAGSGTPANLLLLGCG